VETTSLLKLAGAAVNNLAAQIEKGFLLEGRAANRSGETAVLKQCVEQQRDTSCKVAELETRLAELCDGLPGLSESEVDDKIRRAAADTARTSTEHCHEALQSVVPLVTSSLLPTINKAISEALSHSLDKLCSELRGEIRDSVVALEREIAEVREQALAKAASPPNDEVAVEPPLASPSGGTALEHLPTYCGRIFVRTTGLKSEAWNELPGIVVDETLAPERFGIALPTVRAVKSIKPENLLKYSPSGDRCQQCFENFNLFECPSCGCDPDVLDDFLARAERLGGRG